MRVEMPERLSPAQSDLVTQNMGLAHIIAHEFANRSNEIDREEAVAVAYQGLVSAAQAFDPSREAINPADLLNGKAFAGYARTRIRGTLLDWLRQIDHVRRADRSDYKKVTEAGYPERISLVEAARVTGLEEERIRSVVRAVRLIPASLQAEGLRAASGVAHRDGEGDVAAYEKFLPGEDNVESTATVSLITDATIVEYLQLTQLQQTIIAMKYYAHQELQEIAQRLQVSLSTIRSEHTEAILVLHRAMARNVSRD